jgi:conjugal transfer ATP-binding protein TraC
MEMINQAKKWINKNFLPNNHLAKQSQTMASLSAFIGQHGISEILPYRLYNEENKIYYNEGSQGFVVEASPLVGATDDTIQLIASIINYILPEGASIQFLLYACPTISPILSAWEKERASQGDQFKALAKERVDFLKKGAWGSILKDGEYPIRDFKLFISVTLDSKMSTQAVSTLRDSLLRTLLTIGIPGVDVEPEGLIQLVTELFAPHRSPDSVPRFWRKSDLLNTQFASPDTCTQVHPEGIRINNTETEIRMFSVSKLPENWPQWAMQGLIGDFFLETQRIACPFFLSLSVQIPRQDKEKAHAAMKLMRSSRIAESPAVKYVPEAREISAEWRAIVDETNKNGRIVKLTFQVGLLSTPEKADSDQATLNSLFISNGWHLYQHLYVHLPLLMSCFPMLQTPAMFKDFNKLGVTHTQPGYVVANLAPIQGEFKGMGKPRLMMTGKRGQLMWFDPFSSQSGNYNVCVTGKSGSGKSVFMQELAASIVGSGGRVWIIDVGRSYEKLCKLLGGEFIEFKVDTPICLNPFSLITELTEDQLALLKLLIEQMVAPNDPIIDIERALIEEAIQFTWNQYYQDNNVTHIAEFLKCHDDARAQDIGRRLYPYTEKGMYGRYFNGKATVCFDNRLAVIELEELKNKGDMQAIALMLIIFQITNLIYQGDRKIETACIIDEAWELLRGEKMGLFIESMARRARKYNASLITGTQSIHDYFASPAAQAVYNNSDYTIILSQLPHAIEKLKEDGRFVFTPHKERLIKNLKMRQGAYADIFINAPDWYSVGQMILDDLSLSLYSTKGDEFAAVNTLLKQGLPLIDAVKQVAKEKFHGR